MAGRSLYILDGMALMYRAFYAFFNAPMRTAAGMNSSAMFGFTNTLLSLIEKEKPTHIVACLDPSGPTFRHEIYEQYKANRQAMPQELRDSIPYIIEILEAMCIPVVRITGFEADDLIGTFTRMADEAELPSFMVSQDKDLGQLLSPLCSFWKPGRKGGEYEIIGETEFLEEWGIEKPLQIIDILALMGDSSDNIPGVSGVGGVTAKKLIAQFGSVETMLERSAEIKGKMREKIEQNAQSARLSYNLATIRRDVPVDLSIDDCAWGGWDAEKLADVLSRLEFKGLLKRIGVTPQAEPADLVLVPEPQKAADAQMDLFSMPTLESIETKAHDYILVNTAAAREELAAQLLSAPTWAFDTETTGLDPLCDKLLGISFCIEAGKAYYVPVTSADDLQVFVPIFASDAEKIGLNLKFDLRVLATAGLAVQGPFFDVMIAHAILYPELRHGMDEMAETLLAYRTVRLEEIAGKNYDTAAVTVEQMANYAAEDADVTLQLAHILRPQLEQEGMMQLVQSIEFPLVPVLAAIEQEGMNVEPRQLEEASAALGLQIESLRVGIDEAIGRPLNLNSPKQLGEYLFGELKLLAKPKKTKTGNYVTDEETLRKLIPISPLVAQILEYREMSKLKGTYLDALPRYISPADGRIHSSLQQMVTATGRLASQNPNLQNIPVRSEAGKLIRRAFVPRGEEYSILSADYSQVELRLMAALSGDLAMVEAFKSGHDIHAETAARLFQCELDQVNSDMRRAAKTVNFGIIYGISAFGLSQRLDCTRSQATALIDSYFEQFPKVKVFMDELINEAREKGYAETISGRRRKLADIDSSNFNLRAAAERTAINTPIQGSAADMIKLAMLRVADLLQGTKTRLIMQVHDELLFDLHQDEHHLVPQIEAAMRDAMPLPHAVPLLVEASHASNWLDAH